MTEMSGLEKTIVITIAGLPVMPMATPRDTAEAVSKATVKYLAGRIRAELVCCDIYERVQRDGGDENAIGRAVLRGDGHDLCYWGETAARLVEEEGTA